MKRKINPGNPTGVVELKLKDGIPRLQRTISETGPSIPSDEEHAKVRFVEKPFGLAEETVISPMMSLSSGLRTVHGRIRYSSENDLAVLVKVFLESVLYALGATDVELHSEISTFNIRPDIWVVSARGSPVGVIEVKKPDIPGKTAALQHPNVLGELYDFLRHLPNFHGVCPAFGILTNMNTWRMAWLPMESGIVDVDHVASQVEGIDENDQYEKEDGGDDDSRVKERLPMPSTQEEDEQEEDNLSSFQDDDVVSERVMHVSRIFGKDEPVVVLLGAITSVLCKMIRSTVIPFATPFSNLENRAILKFERSETPLTTYCWARLVVVKPQWNKVGRPKRFLFAIQDLGRGADGRVWLTCTTTGAMCVLKFPLDGTTEAIDREHSVWQVAYPSIRTYRERWCGHAALRMPYFAQVEVAERAAKIALVRKTLITNFAHKKMVHGDVYWRNIGTYMDHRTNEERAVVFDMGRVKSVSTTNTQWVDEACHELLSATHSSGKEESLEIF